MIPQIIYKTFKSLIELYGDKIEYVGNQNDTDYYLFRFPDNEETGFPQVVSFKDDTVTPIIGSNALEILALFNSED